MKKSTCVAGALALGLSPPVQTTGQAGVTVSSTLVLKSR